MSKFDYYYLRDSGEASCATCALSDLKTLLAEGGGTTGSPAARLLAFIQYHEPYDIDDLFRVVDIDCQSWSYVGNNLKRNEAARDLLRDLVGCYDACGSESNYGEICGGCGATLVEEFVCCDFCGQGEYDSNFEYADTERYQEWEMDGNDGPMVRFCGRCEDDWLTGNIEEILMDRRGYMLRFVEHYGGPLTFGGKTDGPIYAAGCRRFTLEHALEHWGSPTHPSQAAARELFNGVLRHAMQRALPNLNVGA